MRGHGGGFWERKFPAGGKEDGGGEKYNGYGTLNTTGGGREEKRGRSRGRKLDPNGGITFQKKKKRREKKKKRSHESHRNPLHSRKDENNTNSRRYDVETEKGQKTETHEPGG